MKYVAHFIKTSITRGTRVFEAPTIDDAYDLAAAEVVKANHEGKLDGVTWDIPQDDAEPFELEDDIEEYTEPAFVPYDWEPNCRQRFDIPLGAIFTGEKVGAPDLTLEAAERLGEEPGCKDCVACKLGFCSHVECQKHQRADGKRVKIIVVSPDTKGAVENSGTPPPTGVIK